MQLKVSREARNDLRDIGRYTQKNGVKINAVNICPGLIKLLPYWQKILIWGALAPASERAISVLHISAILYFTGWIIILFLSSGSYTKAEM